MHDVSRRSPERHRTFRDISDNEVAGAVANARSAGAAIRALDLYPHVERYQALRRRILRLGLYITHWRRQRASVSRPLAERLVVGGYAPETCRTRIKQRVLKAGILRNECYRCGLGPAWQGEPLALGLDHINGVGDDWRPDNLRLLCPNCNSQTPTYRGRNRKRRRAGSAVLPI